MATRVSDLEGRFPDVWITRAIAHLGRDATPETLQAISILLAAKAQVPRLHIGQMLHGSLR